MNRQRQGVVLLAAVLVATAGLPIAAVVVPGDTGGTVAAASGPEAACEIVGEQYPEPGENVTLDARDSKNTTVVGFDLDGDGTTDVIREINFTVTTEYSSGTYDPSVVAKNSTTNTEDTAECGSLVVAENTPPNASFDVGTAPLVVGDPEELVATATDDDGTIDSYLWEITSPTLALGTGPLFEFTPESTSDYVVNLTVTDDDGAEASVERTLEVLPSEPPEAALSANRTVVDEGDAVQFDASSSTDDGSIDLYRWDLDGDGTVDRETDFPGLVYTYESVPGSDWTPTVTVLDNDSQTDTASVALEAGNERPVAALSANRTVLKEGDAVAFDASNATDDGSIDLYRWDLDGDGTVDRETDFPGLVYDYESIPGSHWTPTVTVVDSEGATDTANLTLEAANEPPVAALSANRTVVEEGDAVRFDASNSTDDVTVTLYRWDLDGDGTVDRETDFPGLVYTYESIPGSHWTPTVTVLDDDGATDRTGLRVTGFSATNQAPTAAFSASPSLGTTDDGATTVLPGTTVRLDAAATTDPDGSLASYEWDFDGDGTPDAVGATVSRNVSTITANATLTVTDGGGATDTVPVSIRTFRPPENVSGTLPAGSTSLYSNDPPIARFTVSPSRPEPGDTIRFRSESVDFDGGIDTLTWYVDGTEAPFFSSTYGTADETLVLAAAQGSLSAGTHNITLVVTDNGGATSRATKDVTVTDRGDDPDVTVQVRGTGEGSPGKIVVGEPVAFDADVRVAPGRSVAAVEWDLLGAAGAAETSLSGASVVTSFSEAGSTLFTVTVEDSAGETAVVTKRIDVVARDEVPKVTGVTQDPAGLPLQGVSLDLTYTASVAAGDPIDRVRFELGGRSDVDHDGSNGWTYSFDVGTLSGDRDLTVTAVDADGDSDSKTVTVEVNEPPGWAGQFLSAATGTTAGATPQSPVGPEIRVGQNGQGHTVVQAGFGLAPFGRTESVQAGAIAGPVGVNLEASGLLVYNMSTATVHFSGGYGTGVSAGGLEAISGGIEVDLSAEGLVDARTWTIERAVMRGGVVIKVQLGFTPAFEGKSAELGPKFSLSVSGQLDITQKFADRNGNLETTAGQFRPALGVKGAAGLSLTKFVRFEGSAGGTLEGFIPLSSGKAGLLARLVLTGEYQFLWSKDSVRKVYESRIGDASKLALALDGPRATEGGWTVEEKRPGPPPGTASGTGTGPVVLGLTGEPNGTTRLTRDALADRWPALAHGENYTAVWVRQDPAKNVTDGYDVYASTGDGHNWSDRVAITDDRRGDTRPSVAATDNATMAAWTRIDAVLNASVAPLSALDRAEVAYAVRTEGTWSAPAALTDDAAPDLVPVVAGADGRFLLAWVADPGDANTTADQRVRYAVYDGSWGSTRTIQNATDVAVAGDGDGFALAYLRSDDGTNGTVVRTTVAPDGSRTTRASHPVTGFGDLAVAADGFAWTTGDAVRYAADGATPRTVPTDYRGVRNLRLVADGPEVVLAYRGSAPDEGNPRVVYQRRAGGTWLEPRPLAGGDETDLTFVRAGYAASADGFVAVGAARNVSRESHPDLFAVRKRFAPDLTVTASTDADVANASAGDRIAVNYTIRNAGDRAARGATVTLSNGTGAVASRTHGPLAPGDRTNGTLVGTVDADGRFVLEADPGDAVAETNESNNAQSVVVARPDLSVGPLTERRRGDSVVVEAAIRNRGPVVVENATVALQSGNATLATRAVTLGPGGLWRVRLRAPAEAVDRSLADAVVVDPDDAVVEASEGNNRAGTRLLVPDLGLSEAVNTTAAPGGVLTEAYVENAGTGNATGLVRLAANGTRLTYAVPVDAAPRAGAAVVERVRLYHPTTNGTLGLRVTPRDALDAGGLDGTARTSVDRADRNVPAPVRIVDARATTANGTATLTVVLATDAAAATGVPLTGDGGAEPVTRTVVVPANGTATTELSMAAGDGSTLTVSVPGEERTVSLAAAPDVNGNGQPARDPDGDGLHEDVDGDGTFSIVDVAVLLDRFDRAPVQDNPALFDFDGSGGVNIVDVAELLAET